MGKIARFCVLYQVNFSFVWGLGVRYSYSYARHFVTLANICKGTRRFAFVSHWRRKPLALEIPIVAADILWVDNKFIIIY